MISGTGRNKKICKWWRGLVFEGRKKNGTLEIFSVDMWNVNTQNVSKEHTYVAAFQGLDNDKDLFGDGLLLITPICFAEAGVSRLPIVHYNERDKFVNTFSIFLRKTKKKKSPF